MRTLHDKLLEFISIFLLVGMPLFTPSCGGGRISVSIIEGVEEAGEEEEIEEIEEEVIPLPIASLKLVRLDGTELDPDEIPIPRSVRIKLTFDQPLDESEQAAVQSGFVLREGETSLGVSFQWTDAQTVIITPDSWFGYGKTYSVGLSNEVATWAAQVSKAIEFLELAFTIATRGDVNGDGDVDLIVGAPYAKVVVGGDTRGRAYFFAAVRGMDDCDISAGCQPDATISGAADDNWLGLSVTLAGDINADGYADLVVGAPAIEFWGSSPTRGWVYIFYGSGGGIGDCNLSIPNDCTPDATIIGVGGNDQCGTVSYAGDVNGDGYDDIIVGARAAGDNDQGQAYVFLGSENGILSDQEDNICDLSVPEECAPHATITGAFIDDELGLSVSGAGDVNGDGYDDIIVGARYAAGVVGQAYILHGSGDGIPNCDLSAVPACTPDATITGEAANNDFGFSVYGAGDVNGDGYDDVIVGAPLYTDGMLSEVGRAYVFHGSEAGIIPPEIDPPQCQISGDPACPVATTITGETACDNLGTAVSTAGDVNGDGYDDIIVGAPYYDNVVDDEGRAYIRYGSDGGIISHFQATISAVDEDAFLGSFAFGPGDLNGDGLDDIIVGAFGYGVPGVEKGQAYVLRGSEAGISSCDLAPPDSCDPDITITGAEGDWLGALR
jgi:hypothetical protein